MLKTGSFFVSTFLSLSIFANLLVSKQYILVHNRIVPVSEIEFETAESLDNIIYQTPLPNSLQNTAVLSISTLNLYDESDEETINPESDTDTEITSNNNNVPEEDVVSTDTLNIQPENEIINIPPGTIMLDRINEYRLSLGFPPYATHDAVCAFAQVRVREISSDFSHNGFNSRMGSGTLPYPSFSYAAENIADVSSFEAALDIWKNSPTHNQNLLSDSPYACVAGIGRYFVLLIWTP